MEGVRTVGWWGRLQTKLGLRHDEIWAQSAVRVVDRGGAVGTFPVRFCGSVSVRPLPRKGPDDGADTPRDGSQQRTVGDWG